MLAYMELLDRLPMNDEHIIYQEVMNVLQACETTNMRHLLQLGIARRMYKHYPDSPEVCCFFARWLFSESEFLVEFRGGF